MLPHMKRSSQRIQTAFILSLVVRTFFDVSAVFLFFFSGQNTIYFAADPIIYVSVAITPIVLAIVALSLLANTKPATPCDRVFKILTKIFSIISIVEICILIIVIAFFIFVILVLAGAISFGNA